MRIGMVCPYSFDEPGGVQAHIIDVARTLISHGHHVEVLGPATDAADVPAFVQRGGRSVGIPFNGSVARLAIGPHVQRRVIDFIEQGRFDVLHIHEPASPSYSMAALAVASGPIVATYHTYSESSRLASVARPALSPLLEKISGEIAVSETARRWHVGTWGGDPVLIPNGVDTCAFASARDALQTCDALGSRNALEARHDLGDAALHIAFVGRLDEPRKGLGILTGAIEKLAQRRTTLRESGHRLVPLIVDVMGSGKATPQLRLNPQAGIEVLWHGRVTDEEKARLLARADILVAPNLGGESFGIVLVEAMAAGCAVVASNLESFADVCAAGSTRPAGRLFPVGSPAALEEVLYELTDAPEASARRRALQEAGLQRARRFDWAVVAADILTVYHTVAEGQPIVSARQRSSWRRARNQLAGGQ